jgi:hypothetical protein
MRATRPSTAGEANLVLRVVALRLNFRTCDIKAPGCSLQAGAFRGPQAGARRQLTNCCATRRLVHPLKRDPRSLTAWHIYPVPTDFPSARSRPDLMRALGAEGIGTQVHYIPSTASLLRRALWRAGTAGAKPIMPRR